MGEIVTLEVVGAVALVALDNPPVNAASHALRQGILEALDAASRDARVEVVALWGRGRAFVAGADIREFGQPPRAPSLPEVVDALEDCELPVIAVLHGVALGGGLEIALGCHARVGIEGLRVGLPEVALGLMPGAGGTQRTPRLTGIAPAIDLVTTGRHVAADEALALGLIDRLVAGEPREVALAAAREVVEGTLATRRTGALVVEPDDDAVAEARARVASKDPHLFSPVRCVDAVAASTRPIREGLAEERRLFEECLDSPQRAGLVHAFFAERAVAKVPEAGAAPRDVGAVGVVGAGTMGAGIATAALLAGLDVVLTERDADALERGRATVLGNLDGAVKRGKMDAGARGGAEARLACATGLDALADVDLVIEAAFEDMDVKAGIFRELDRVCRSGAVLATNTSYLDVDAIAAVTARPADVIGLHFFSPAHVMRLMEVVVGRETAPEVVATGFALAARMKKVAVRAGVCDGFIGNRILTAYRRAADYLVLDGAAPAQVDAALEGWGFAMGPFRTLDLAGGDIGWAARKRRAPHRPATERYSAIPDRLAERGWFGRKTGRGWYDHTGDRPVPTPEVAAIVEAERDAAGIVPRAFDDAEIVGRTTTAMIAEGARVLEDGIALRPVDVDAVFLFGYGFPRFRGGPMFHADTVGAVALVERIERWSAEDADFWRVPDLLRDLARGGGTFAAMNAP